jgi:phenylalanyl-tRNA synthetase beta chain
MKVSVNALRHINQHEGSTSEPLQKGVKDLTVRIGVQLGAIEEVIPFGDRYKDVLVVKVVSCRPHEDSDHLHVCMIDDGGKAKGVVRDEAGFVQVVTGAPNVKANMYAAWLRPGVAVPETIDKEPLVLEARALRGVMSYGMFASTRELGLNDDHTGILEITENDVDDGVKLKPGMPFGDLCHLTGDVVLDIENKMFTHRPDCFGWLGVAREIEGIYGRKYKSPKWYSVNPKFSGIEAEPLKVEVINELPELVPRFTAITMRDVHVGKSPLWLQVDLARAGMRSINNIVDFTNWYMILTGQPLHAYDYDKVVAKDPGAKHATLKVRLPKKGEKIALLNGKTIEPTAKTIMISTQNEAIGVGGVMGGSETEVDETTHNIIIEAATFDMYNIRRTSMALGLFTDAVTRFTKGQSPLQNLAALGKMTESVRKYAHGKVAGPVVDINHLPKAVRERRSLHPPVRITADFINERLGLSLKKQDITMLLTNVEFDVSMTGRDISVTAPFWRTDIEIPEDVVEEVGRLNGYDKLPFVLPKRDLTPPSKDETIELKNWVRERLVRAGANELLTYTFVHGDLMTKSGQDTKHAFKLSNALSPDLQYFRTGLTPSLLDKVHTNIKAGFDSFALFELNKVHYKGEMDFNEPDVPNEDSHVALVLAYEDKQQPIGAPYYQARKYLEQIVDLSVVDLKPLSEFDVAKDEWGKQLTAPFEPLHSAIIVKDDQIWGVVGEFKAAVRKALKLPAYAAGFELHLNVVSILNSKYVPIPRFPKVEQDLTLSVPASQPYKEVYDFVADEVDKLKPENVVASLSPVDIYQREGDSKQKQITLRLSVASYERTLTDAEVTKLLDQIAAGAKTKF